MNDEERSRFPEYAKYYDKAQFGDSQTIGEFIDWLGSTGYTICNYEYPDDPYEVWREYFPSRKQPEEWICEFYDIDYKQAMIEKEEFLREMLDALRSANS